MIHKETRYKIGVIVCNLSQFTSCTFKNPNATKNIKRLWELGGNNVWGNKYGSWMTPFRFKVLNIVAKAWS